MSTVSVTYTIPHEFTPGQPGEEFSLFAGDTVVTGDGIIYTVTSSDGPITAFAPNPLQTAEVEFELISGLGTTVLEFRVKTIAVTAPGNSTVIANFTNDGGVQFNITVSTFGVRSVKLNVPEDFVVNVGDPWPVIETVEGIKQPGDTFAALTNDSGIPPGITFTPGAIVGDSFPGSFSGTFTTVGTYTIQMSVSNTTGGLHDTSTKTFTVTVNAAPAPAPAPAPATSSTPTECDVKKPYCCWFILAVVIFIAIICFVAWKFWNRQTLQTQ